MQRALLILAAAMLSLAQAAPDARPPIPVSSSRPAPTAPAPDAALADLTAFLERASKLKEEDIEGRLTLARWARDRKMYEQAQEMANQALYRDPGNRAAYLVLQQIDDARPLPEQKDLEATLKGEMLERFKHPFSTRNSKHFLIVYDTTDAFAVQRAVAMEKAYDAFQFYFNMNKLRPEFLQNRLVMILLKDRADYLAYAQQTEKNDMSWSGGFYSTRTNRSIFFDELSGPSSASYSKQTTELKTKIDTLNTQISAAAGKGQTGLVNTLTVEKGRAAEDLFQLTNRANSNAQVQNNSTTMHEAAHQIAYNMGIQTRGVDYPFWFSEGLACGFEVEDSAGRRGPALINYGRVPGIKDAIRDNKLLPLEQIITANPQPTAATDVLRLQYAQSWALFHYLYKFQREGMEKFIVSYKYHTPYRSISADERKVIFTAAFGADLEALNTKWVAYLKSLPAKPN
jgi:hypothetical protein